MKCKKMYKNIDRFLGNSFLLEINPMPATTVGLLKFIICRLRNETGSGTTFGLHLALFIFTLIKPCHFLRFCLQDFIYIRILTTEAARNRG